MTVLASSPWFSRVFGHFEKAKVPRAGLKEMLKSLIEDLTISKVGYAEEKRSLSFDEMRKSATEHWKRTMATQPEEELRLFVAQLVEEDNFKTRAGGSSTVRKDKQRQGKRVSVFLNELPLMWEQ